MRKSYLGLMVIIMLFVPTIMSYAGEQSPHQSIKESQNIINQALENIDDESRKNKIDELLNTPICFVVCIEGEEVSEFKRPQYDYSKLINYLADLSEDEFCTEGKQLVIQIVNENKNNSNIIWTKDFKNDVIEEYCPQYQDQLQTQLLIESTCNVKNDFASRAVPSGQDQKTAVAKCEAFGNELYRLSCTVKWSWGDNKLKSVTATPSYKIASARYEFRDYSHPVNISKDNNTAEIVVQGHFVETFVNLITYKHHYATLSIVVDKNGKFSATPSFT